MKVWVFTFVTAFCALAADPEQLAVALKAQSQFDRVELAPVPELPDTGACAQSQAAALSVSAPEEASLLYFRKGYCTLAGATVTRGGRDYQAAAADFDRAIEAWPARLGKTGKAQVAEPVSSGLRVLPWIARLHGWTDAEVRDAARREIAAAVAAPSCSSNVMPAQQCEQLIVTARQWLGWIALKNGDLAGAATNFAGERETGWSQWVEGRRVFALGNYTGAVREYSGAIGVWKAAWDTTRRALIVSLGPAPDLPGALADLGGAQLLVGDPKSAIASLDASIKADPSNQRAYYLRARAREIAGQPELALADYGLASRTAFADAKDLASGEAHLYRGIMLYRRKDFARAEDEFASALNFEIAGAQRGDAEAWRHLAAVAAGSCGAALESLDRSLAGASPYFPREEARQLEASCAATASAKPAER